MKKSKYVCKSAATDDICSELADCLTKRNETDGEIITVTSIAPQQGKSYFLFRLAQLIGKSGKNVLIINANSQAPDICEKRGLYDLSCDTISQDEIMSSTYDTNIPNVKIMPLGNMTDSEQADFGFVFSILKENFSCIFIELASLDCKNISPNITNHADRSFTLLRSGIIDMSDESMISELRSHMNSLPLECQKYIVNLSSDNIRSGYKEIFISGINQMIPEV